MDVVTKSVDAPIRHVESENPNGEFEVILSTDALDRDGEHLYIDEWKQPLPARIHIDGDHGMTLEKTVGSVVPRIEGNQMIGKGTFAPTPYAQMVRSIVNDPNSDSHAISMSVTFSEKKNHKDGKPQRELLNAAFVAVPANPEAVILSSKAMKTMGLDASGNNPRVAHDDMVQAVHDAACALGAECANEIEADPGTSDGGNKSVTPETLDTKSVELPPESPDESPAEIATKAATPVPAGVPIDAADDVADDAAVKERLALRARALSHLMTKNAEKDSDNA